MREHEILNAMKPSQIKKNINAAVRDHELPESWKAPATNKMPDLIDHVEDICNEWGFTVNDDGTLLKS